MPRSCDGVLAGLHGLLFREGGRGAHVLRAFMPAHLGSGWGLCWHDFTERYNACNESCVDLRKTIIFQL